MDLELAKKLLELGSTGILAIAIAYILRVFAEIRKVERADAEQLSLANQKRLDSTINGLNTSLGMVTQLAGSLTQASVATGSVIQDARELVRETRELTRDLSRPKSGEHPV